MTEKAKQLGSEKLLDISYEETSSGVAMFTGYKNLTKREYFAGLFMQALISNPERYKYIAERVKHGMSNREASEKNAHKAVLLADALLEELSKD